MRVLITPENINFLHRELGPLFQELTQEWIAITGQLLQDPLSFKANRPALRSAGNLDALRSYATYPFINYTQQQFILVTEKFSSCLGNIEPDLSASLISTALHHVLFECDQAATYLKESKIYKKLEPYGEDFLDVNILSGLRETVTTFQTIMLSATEVFTQEERLALLHDLAYSNTITQPPYSRFDSTLAALSFTTNGFWGSLDLLNIQSGVFIKDSRTNKISVDSQLLSILSTNIRKEPNKFAGGCPVAYYHPSMPNGSGLSAITQLGRFILEEAMKLLQNPQFRAQVPRLTP